METSTAEKTNPVIDTARLTLSQLAAAGVSEASALADRLGLTDAMRKYDVGKAVVSPFAVIQEARYQFLNRCFTQSGANTILDAACGFSPRGMMLAQGGLHYLGMDLEAAVHAMNEVAAAVAAEKSFPGSFRYQLVDITNPTAIQTAADAFEGPVAMGCEGLLVYLGEYEFESMIQGVAAVLHRHGGCFVTPDFNTAGFMAGILMAVLGEDAGMKALLELRSSIQSHSDVTFGTTVTAKKAPAFYSMFARYGLAYEEIPFLPEDAVLHSFSGLTPGQIAEIRRRLSPVTGLRLTAKSGACQTDLAQTDSFHAESSLTGTVLQFVLTGRLDSISAPLLLDLFGKHAGVTAITIDASALEYISSAGLRTLLIMQKALKESRIRILHPTEPVMDILEQTGFADLLTITA